MVTISIDIGDEEGVTLPSPMPMTEVEYDRWDSEFWTGEWVGGIVECFPPATLQAYSVRMQLVMILAGYVVNRQLGEIRGPNYAVRIAEPPRRRLPDLMYVSSARRAILKDRFCDGPPDLALEIVAPESTSRDYRVKYQEYEAFGIREYWIVDPQAEIVEASSLDADGVYQPIPNVAGRIASAVVPGWFLKPEWLWTDPPWNPIDVLRELKVI